MPAFPPAGLAFLAELAANNDRPWFTANKARYERDVKAPLVAIVRALAEPLAEIDSDARVGDASIFRIHRDTRFAKDKAPYKTHVAAQFPHGDVRGPSGYGYYLHVEPGRSFFAGGVWMPEPAAAARIRAALAKDPDGWRAAVASAGGLGAGPTLARVPKPWSADHPLADDLRRKSFTASVPFTDAEVTGDEFVDRIVAAAARLAPLVRLVGGAANSPA